MRRLTFVNAAQVPPVLVRAGGAIEFLEEGGTPVGMFPAARYQEGAVTLHPGDAVVCFSDGISEATNTREEMWDQEAYLALLQSCVHLSAGETVDALMAGADAFADGAEQADDMTVVVLKSL